jgi:hypothetical protein
MRHYTCRGRGGQALGSNQTSRLHPAGTPPPLTPAGGGGGGGRGPCGASHAMEAVLRQPCRACRSCRPGPLCPGGPSAGPCHRTDWGISLIPHGENAPGCGGIQESRVAVMVCGPGPMIAQGRRGPTGEVSAWGVSAWAASAGRAAVAAVWTAGAGACAWRSCSAVAAVRARGTWPPSPVAARARQPWPERGGLVAMLCAAAASVPGVASAHRMHGIPLGDPVCTGRVPGCQGVTSLRNSAHPPRTRFASRETNALFIRTPGSVVLVRHTAVELSSPISVSAAAGRHFTVINVDVASSGALRRLGRVRRIAGGAAVVPGGGGPARGPSDLLHQ